MLVMKSKPIVDRYRKTLTDRVHRLKAQGIDPAVVSVVAGDDPASQSYARVKASFARSIGAGYRIEALADSAKTDDLVRLIRNLNADPAVHGIMVEMPLPEGVDVQAVVSAIDPAKDLDALNPVNLGRLLAGYPAPFVPNTPLGIMKLLEAYYIPVEGQHAVVLGRSAIVGRPLAELLLQANATVTVCHSHTPDLAQQCREADIVISAMGQPHKVTGDMVKPGVTLVDVGTTYINGKVHGDIDPVSVESVAGARSPVPGGVGPMTTVMVFDQLLTQLEKGEA